MSAYLEVPDAPWIREAEMYGPDDAEDIPVICPACGAREVEDFWFDVAGNICGCSECMRRKDAYQWTMEHREIHE